MISCWWPRSGRGDLGPPDPVRRGEVVRAGLGGHVRLGRPDGRRGGYRRAGRRGRAGSPDVPGHTNLALGAGGSRAMRASHRGVVLGAGPRAGRRGGWPRVSGGGGRRGGLGAMEWVRVASGRVAEVLVGPDRSMTPGDGSRQAGSSSSRPRRPSDVEQRGGDIDDRGPLRGSRPFSDEGLARPSAVTSRSGRVLDQRRAVHASITVCVTQPRDRGRRLPAARSPVRGDRVRFGEGGDCRGEPSDGPSGARTPPDPPARPDGPFDPPESRVCAASDAVVVSTCTRSGLSGASDLRVG